MSCGSLTGARMNMRATLLHQNDPYVPSGEIVLEQYGEWVQSQDPLTGEIVRVWKPFDDVPETPDVDESVTLGNISCIARGIVDGGIRVAGTTEWFSDDYRNIDFVKMWVPPEVRISKRDRVTNIRDRDGHIRWLDEEFSDPREITPPRATVFNVNGVTPLFNAFNRIVEQFVLLERAESSGTESE